MSPATSTTETPLPIRPSAATWPVSRTILTTSIVMFSLDTVLIWTVMFWGPPASIGEVKAM